MKRFMLRQWDAASDPVRASSPVQSLGKIPATTCSRHCALRITCLKSALALAALRHTGIEQG
jgi:hypothetical protein